MRSYQSAILVFKRQTLGPSAIEIVLNLSLDIRSVEVVVAGGVLHKWIPFGVHFVHRSREPQNVCKFVHADKQYLLEALLVKFEVIIVEHDHPPDGPLGRLQKHAGDRFGNIDRI